VKSAVNDADREIPLGYPSPPLNLPMLWLAFLIGIAARSRTGIFADALLLTVQKKRLDSGFRRNDRVWDNYETVNKS